MKKAFRICIAVLVLASILVFPTLLMTREENHLAFVWSNAIAFGIFFGVMITFVLVMFVSSFLPDKARPVEEEDEDLGGGINLQCFGDDLAVDPADVVCVAIVEDRTNNADYGNPARHASVLLVNDMRMTASEKAGKDLIAFLSAEDSVAAVATGE